MMKVKIYISLRIDFWSMVICMFLMVVYCVCFFLGVEFSNIKYC